MQVEVLPPEDQEQVELGIVTLGEISAVKIGHWQQAQKLAEMTDQRIENMLAEAKQIEVKNADSRDRAGQVTAALKSASKDGEAIFAPYEQPLRRVSEWLRQKRQKLVNRCEMGRGILAQKMAQYDRAEEQKAAAEQRRIQEETEKQNKQQADRELKVGDISKKEHKARVANPPQVAVAPAIPKVAGNVRRINYSATCTNQPGFVKALCEAYADRKNRVSHDLFVRLASMVIVSDQRLSAQARGYIKTSPQDDKHELTKEQFKALYPFVEVNEERTY